MCEPNNNGGSAPPPPSKHSSSLQDAASPYKECLKNHAAKLGGHALDGCGEFMPASISLICAACGCHRNFHRRFECSYPQQSDLPASPLAPHTPCTAPLMLLALGKRRRTKFRGEEKEKIRRLADESGVKEDAGVSRGVLRVWMHDNKNSDGGFASGDNNVNGSPSSS